MVSIKKFVFGPFQENTYVLYDESRDCWIIGPGCYFQDEFEVLESFIAKNSLRPVRLINTHCHIDHIYGNHKVCDKYDLLPEFHNLELEVFDRAEATVNVYDLKGYEASPEPVNFLSEGDILKLGDEQFEVLFLPGHAPGHLGLYNAREKYLMSGDVLFRGSIGRTDLPGGNFETLIRSIETKLMVLPPDVIVYSGHGPETKIGEEKRYNPFLRKAE